MRDVSLPEIFKLAEDNPNLYMGVFVSEYRELVRCASLVTHHGFQGTSSFDPMNNAFRFPNGSRVVFRRAESLNMVIRRNAGNVFHLIAVSENVDQDSISYLATRLRGVNSLDPLSILRLLF